MIASDWVKRGLIHSRVVLQAADVHRGECLTGCVEVRANGPRPARVPELSITIGAKAVVGAAAQVIRAQVAPKGELAPGETHEFPFSLEVPTSTLLGAGQLDLTIGRGITRSRLVRLPLTVLPERHLHQVIHLIASIAQHGVWSWASSPSVSGMYVHLAPEPSMRERASRITVELETVGLHLHGKLTLTAITEKSWLDSKERQFNLHFQTRLSDVSTFQPDLDYLRSELEPFFRTHLGVERQLPIPHEPEADADELPIPVC